MLMAGVIEAYKECNVIIIEFLGVFLYANIDKYILIALKGVLVEIIV